MEVQSPAPMKRHYDITMSRRTRKQSFPFPVQANNEKPKSVMNATTTKDTNLVVSFDQTPTSHHIPGVKESTDNNHNHKSLKQLINGDEKKDDDDAKMIKNSGRNSLGEHFNEEEKQLQLVLVPQKDDKNNNLQGLKFKKLVRRYAKVLGHLMKAKRDPHLGEAAGKKPIFKLST